MKPPALTHGSQPPARRFGVLQAIAIFKLVKVTLLVLTGMAAIHLLHSPDMEQTLKKFALQWRFDPDGEHVHWLITQIAGVSPRTLKALSIGTFIYAAFYLTEGVGLLLGYSWAEWLTVVTTAGLIPVEIYEICVRLTALRVLLFLANVAIMAYLIWNLRRQHDAGMSEKTAAVSSPTAAR